MYSSEDSRAANQLVKSHMVKMFIPMGVLLAVYVVMAVIHVEWAMMAALTVLFAFTVFYFDMYLLPAVRYRRFIWQIEEGLRRETDAEIVELAQEAQLQDGAQVFPLRVLAPDGDERMFWVNISKAEMVPEPGTRVHLESSGRHVTAMTRLEA